MPAPAVAVYVIAIVGGCAAAYAFKELVYDPHIVPAVEKWQAQFTARRRERRGLVPVQPNDDPTSAGTELQNLVRNRDAADEAEERKSKELENMVTKEVDEWRSAVDRSQSGLRHRTNVGMSSDALEESNPSLPYTPMSPTHIIFDFSNETSPTSSHPSASTSAAIRVAGPPSSSAPFSPISSIHPSDSASLAGQTTPQISPRVQPPSLSFTYDAQALSLSPPVIVSPTLPTPSPSNSSTSISEFIARPSHPHGLGLELLSAPSSRPDTPFSSFSVSSPGSGAGSFDFPSPQMLNLGVSVSPTRFSNNSRTLSDVNPVSAVSHTPSRTVSEADFLSAIGDEDFDVLSRSTRSNASSAAGDEFDLGSVSEAESWASVSQPRR